MPKKIKLFLFKKNVTDVIKAQINNKTPRRLKEFSDKVVGKAQKSRRYSGNDYKTSPTDCANNSGSPWVIVSSSIKLKYPYPKESGKKA